MPTSVACPKCERQFHVPPELLGKRLRCLQCQHVFAVPTSDPRRSALQPDAAPLTVEARIKRSGYDIPGYLWPLAAVPWALLVLALGGCIWGLLAAVAAVALFAVGITLVQARQLSVALRLAGLLLLDGIAACLILLGGVVFVIGPSASSSRRPADEPEPPPVRALFRQGPRVYLAELQEFGVQSGQWPFRKNGTIGNGRLIRVNGVLSPQGLSMHPPPSPGFASVRYRLGKQAVLFRAAVAINDSSKWCFSPATFTVLGDGNQLWKSNWIAHNHAHFQECSLDVSGVDVLELRVHCENGNNGVHAVWVQPRLLQKADTPDE